MSCEFEGRFIFAGAGSNWQAVVRQSISLPFVTLSALLAVLE